MTADELHAEIMIETTADILDNDAFDDLPDQICETGVTKVFQIPLLNKELSTIIIHQDSSQGCGGKTWDAAHVLYDYLSWSLHNVDTGKFNILELGSGTGICGIMIAKLLSAIANGNDYKNPDWNVYLTDLDYLTNLIKKNVSVNFSNDEDEIASGSVLSHILVKELKWGIENQISEIGQIDLIIGADCIYLEETFDALIDTLKFLCKKNPQLEIVLASKKRRSADKKFWNSLKKFFKVCKVYDSPNAIDNQKSGHEIMRCKLKSIGN